MEEEEVSQFLTWLAAKKVAASTQNQALCALLFLYKEVLKKILAGCYKEAPAKVLKPACKQRLRIKKWACLSPPACGQGQTRPSGRLDFYPKINRRFRVKSTHQKMNVDFSHLSQHSLLFTLAF